MWIFITSNPFRQIIKLFTVWRTLNISCYKKLMGYTKTSDHPYLLHPPLLTPIHAHPPKMYSHLPPPTHKNCPLTLSYHKHPSPPTQKKCLPTTTNPKYTSAHLHPAPLHNIFHPTPSTQSILPPTPIYP